MYKASFMQLSTGMYMAYTINPQSFSMHILWLHIYTAWLFLCFLPNPFAPLATPSPSPLYPLSLTWRPPAVTGTVLPLIRLLVDWPYLPLPSPINPPIPNSHNPNSSTPDNDDIGATPLPLCGTVPFYEDDMLHFLLRSFLILDGNSSGIKLYRKRKYCQNIHRKNWIPSATAL